MQVTRRLEFPAGHRLMNHEGGCKDLHGHNYSVEITVEGDKLDEVGRVIDFDVIRDLIYGWILDHWDHGFLLNRHDTEVIAAIGPYCKAGKPYLMDSNPTAENIALELYRMASPVLASYPVRIVSVRVQEMEGCWATYLPPTR